MKDRDCFVELEFDSPHEAITIIDCLGIGASECLLTDAELEVIKRVRTQIEEAAKESGWDLEKVRSE